ncbi:MAG TPA: hypothetical protein PKE12_10200 [Kiritimatiellia bacterium]|nr:hypothetical protein [Kiritimatiellia bacterium]
MKKTIVIALGLAVMAGSAFAQTNQVLSRNAVGYVKIEAVRSNFVFIANNFSNLLGGPVTVTNLIGNQVPIGSSLFLWDPAAQAYRSESLLFSGWTPGTNRLNTGRGFWLKIADAGPSNVYQVYLMGEVPDKNTQPTGTIPIVSGFNMVSLPYPVSIAFTSTALAKSGAIGDSAFFWNPVSKTYYSESLIFSGWTPGTNRVAPGQAFWYRRGGSATNWVEVKPYTWP